MKIKIKLTVLIFLLTTITLFVINLNNKTKTHLYFLNFKTEKLTLGNFISLSFLTGFTTVYSLSYLTAPKNENQILIEEKFDKEPEIIKDNINTEIDKKEIRERPPERDIRESQPTISVNYRVIKQNDNEVNDISDEYIENRTPNKDDWGQIESNW
tara:strand:+ start:3287 stop:3754 length:468 start_codon:yes stop_codon:yes gene_type:complete